MKTKQISDCLLYMSEGPQDVLILQCVAKGFNMKLTYINPDKSFASLVTTPADDQPIINAAINMLVCEKE